MANKELKIKKGAVIYSQGLSTTVLDVQGESGQLFSVTDSLTGLLHHVSNISGIPILEVYSDDRVLMGKYGAYGLEVSGSNIILPTTSSTTTYNNILVLEGGIIKTLTTSASFNGNGDITLSTTTGSIIATSPDQKLGIWGKTPIIQPTSSIAESVFIENAGGVTINDNSTFDGYTLRQVVKALRDIGLLA
jgi:hypothetical protein